MAVAVIGSWLQPELDGLATFTRGRDDVQLGLHLRDALELHSESRAEIGDLQRLRLQLFIELYEGGHWS